MSYTAAARSCTVGMQLTSVGVVQTPRADWEAMDNNALTVKTVRDGPVCTLVLIGDLDLSETSEFLVQAALAVDDRTERLVLDLAGVTFLDCAGVRALAVAASFAPGGCPVIIRSLSPRARQIFERLDLDKETLQPASPELRTTRPARAARPVSRNPATPELYLARGHKR